MSQIAALGRPASAGFPAARTPRAALAAGTGLAIAAVLAWPISGASAIDADLARLLRSTVAQRQT